MSTKLNYIDHLINLKTPTINTEKQSSQHIAFNVIHGQRKLIFLHGRNDAGVQAGLCGGICSDQTSHLRYPSLFTFLYRVSQHGSAFTVN